MMITYDYKVMRFLPPSSDFNEDISIFDQQYLLAADLQVVWVEKKQLRPSFESLNYTSQDLLLQTASTRSGWRAKISNKNIQKCGNAGHSGGEADLGLGVLTWVRALACPKASEKISSKLSLRSQVESEKR